MLQINLVNLKQLYYDPKNPRMPQYLYGSVDELEVIDYMIRYGNIIELMESIAQLGYSEAEPLLVVPKEENSKQFIVVEGNRRLTALKLLNNPEIAKVRKNSIVEVCSTAEHKPTSIPVIIYQTRDDVLNYLGYRHITGVKDWGALEKAKYLDQLYDLHINEAGDQIYKVLAKMIGSRSDYVERLHTSLKLYELANNEAYFGAKIKEKDFNFSWLTTALSYTGIKEYLGIMSTGDYSIETLDKEHYKHLFTWLFHPEKKKVEESRNITELNEVIKSEPALKKLEEGNTIAEALIFTTHPSETFISLILSAKDNLQSSKNMIEQLSTYPEAAIKAINEIEKICKTITGAINENFQPSGKDEIKNVEKKLTPDQINKLLSLIEEQGE
ncbi:ParB N-terminal domain-containing protein [Bacillus subtilis]|uniref:ParB N-terminal domain-containing protein n=1 Tax=Bacillus subtilis TaxID=1423 RepID=UPI0029C164F7|nr:ParB N-terminal domain-containing protein [Bacillus subtilis]MDX6156660.1 ParB N-terminal domain-containing protein [Bacillus subtilis]